MKDIHSVAAPVQYFLTLLIFLVPPCVVYTYIYYFKALAILPNASLLVSSNKWVQTFPVTSGLLCPSKVDETGKPVNPGYLSSRFRKCIVTNELPHITLHGLRHSVLVAKSTLDHLSPQISSRRRPNNAASETAVFKIQQIENKNFLGDRYNENDYVEVDETGKPVNPGYLSSRFRKCIVTNELFFLQ